MDEFIRIDKRVARRLWDEGVAIIIVGDNVNSFHFFGGWHLAIELDKHKHAGEYGNNFNSLVNGFEFYLEPELGRRAAFYVRKKWEGYI